MGKQLNHKGAVSIFAVIFASILLTILTVGFIKIMVEDQSQATKNDLSQSAYDAALAGVEDAKRALHGCYTKGPASVECMALNANSDDCNVIANAFGLAPGSETVIQSNFGDESEAFDQAYTCVNIDMYTDDYLFNTNEGESEMVPLKARNDFNQIVIEWYTAIDSGAPQATSHGVIGNDSLPSKSAWGAATPPILRTQLINPGANINVADLDSSDASATVFVKPDNVMTGIPANPNIDMTPAAIPRVTADGEFNNSARTIVCSEDYQNSNKYACRVTFDLGAASMSVADSANAFLRIGTIYNNASVKISLFNNSSPVQFDGVQPEVDSTGRANSLFRRVKARLRIGDDFPYPNYAIDVRDSLCKDFSVDINTAKPGTCDPNATTP